MSNTNIIIAVIAVLILGVGGYFLFASHSAAAPMPVEATPTTPAVSTNASSTGATPTVVTYTDKGFSPATFTVKLGTTVRFVNNSSHKMWVAAGNHPTHTTYDGTTEQQHCTNGTNNNGSFDECTAVDPGTVYSFTFNKIGTFTFHNHIQASDGGTVTITS
jgi:plastocyanin